MKLFSLKTAQDINNHLLYANKFIYHLEKKIYGPLITAAQENGYCLYHTATALRLLEQSAEGEKVEIQDVCGRTSMNLRGVDAMIATMEDLQNTLIHINPLVLDAADREKMREIQEFTDISIGLWQAYKEEHLEALQHNQALEKGEKKGRKKKILDIKFRHRPGQQQK
jgi:hypothetical protein